MRCLFFIGSLKTGGAERSVSRLSSHLAERGHEVHVVLRRKIIAFDLHDDVKVHVLDGWDHKYRLIKLIRFRKKLKAKIVEIAPDVSVAYTSLNGVILASLLVNNTIIRFDVYPLTLKYWKRILMLTFPRLSTVKKVVCLTSDTKQDLSHFLPSDKLVVINNAALPEEIAQEEPVSSSTHNMITRPYMVSIGRLVRTKGVDVSLRAYAKHKLYERCDFAVVGDGAGIVGLKKLVEKLDISDYVHFLGFQKYPFPLMKDAICLVHASRREGFPNVLVEALSLGTPVISTNCKTGPSEIIIDGYNGYLVPVDDEELLGQRMLHVASDTEDRQHLASNAKPSVDRFSEENIFGSWESILISLS